jgi:hypothetical protein
MTKQENSPESELEPKEVGNQLVRLVAWFAVAAVAALLVTMCVLVIYLLTSG